MRCAGSFRDKRRTVSLALQGGGSHGAFTWGVLDRLLAEEDLRFDAISGASAGAVNALLVASGLHDGGASAARYNLATFWERVASRNGVEAFIAHSVRLLSRDFSPRQLNPFDISPLRALVYGLIDFDALRKENAISLFVGATDPIGGTLRVFRNHELTIETLLASTCLPQLTKSLKIEGAPFWDGGFLANPPLFPLVHDCDARDIVVVRVEPARIPALPTTARAIADRMNQLMFGAPLSRELEAVVRMQSMCGFVTRLVNPAARKLHRLRLHMLEAPEHMGALSMDSKFDTDNRLIRSLHSAGVAVAERWLSGLNPARQVVAPLERADKS